MRRDARATRTKPIPSVASLTHFRSPRLDSYIVDMPSAARIRDLLLASTLLVTAAASAAPPAFTIVDLGTLGGAESVAFGVNELGDVVGWSLTRGGQQHACAWYDGVGTDLGTLGGTASRAWAINDAGTIVGESLLAGGSGDANFKAFIVDGGPMTMLPGLGGSWSVGYAINQAGVITGTARNAQQQEKMVRWTNGQITNLGPLTTQQRSRGYGINANGAIAGWGYTPLGGPNDSLLYSPPINDIIQIGGFGQFQNSEAYDVNDVGIVVGNSSPGSGNWTAALWYPEAITTPVIVGSVDSFEISEFYDINNGDIADTAIAVGRAYTFEQTPEPSHAIYFDGTTLYDLNDFLPEGTEGYLFEAREVNDSGQIAATLFVNGGFRAVLLVPAVALAGDLDGNGAVDAADLSSLLGAWGGAGAADLDGDGTVGASDLAVLLGNWS
jgi:probable HAF family extracellular repeat protein